MNTETRICGVFRRIAALCTTCAGKVKPKDLTIRPSHSRFFTKHGLACAECNTTIFGK